jgi:hypothetical protein
LLILALTPTLTLIWRRPGVLVAGALLLSALVPWGMEQVSTQRSPKAMGLALRSQWQPGAALVGYRLYSQGISFYSGQVFHLLSFSTELDYGRKLAGTTSLFFDTSQEMAAFVRTRPLVFFFLRAEDRASLEQELPGKFLFLARQKNSILISYGEESLLARENAKKNKDLSRWFYKYGEVCYRPPSPQPSPPAGGRGSNQFPGVY